MNNSNVTEEDNNWLKIKKLQETDDKCLNVIYMFSSIMESWSLNGQERLRVLEYLRQETEQYYKS